MPGRLSGKVAVVTGASKGIGAGIAKQLAAEGARVAVNYSSSRQAADAVVAEIKAAGGEARAIQADVAQPEQIDKLFAEVREHFGPVDILVNNAGIYEFAPLEEITPEHFHRQFNLNVLGLLLTTQAAVKDFNPRGGAIINVSSVVVSYTPPGGAVYSGTKAAVDVATRTLAKELGPRGIRINSVNPGMVDTEGARDGGLVDGDFRKQVEAQTPLGRIGAPADIATAVAFLASADASWITGETLTIAGGLR